MFDNPSSGGLYVEDGRYVVKVKALEPTPAKDDLPPGVKWIFTLTDMNGEVIEDDKGFAAEMWQFSSKRLSPRAKARKWAEALLGRPINDADTGETLAEDLRGKRAVALIGQNDKERTTILSMTPLPKKKAQGEERSNGKPASSPDMPPDEVLAKTPVGVGADDEDE